MDLKQRLKHEDLEAFFNKLIAEEKSSATMSKYRRDLQCFFCFLGDDRSVDKTRVIEYKQYLQETYAAASVNSMLAPVNSFLAFLGCPDCRVKQIKIQKNAFCSDEKELTKREYQLLVKAAGENGNVRLSMILQTIGATGIRIGELAHITAEAVEQGVAEVRCKNKVRRIFIPRKLRSYLLGYIRSRKIRKGPVFITKNNRPIDRSNVWTEMKKLCLKAKVSAKKVFPHNLRHLFARTYYNRERDLVKLADILGHSQIETTRLYTISTGREHQRQMEALGLVCMTT